MMKQIKERGFTLIELLVVIAIIGILAGVVLTSLNSARDGAQDSKARSQLASMRAEAEIFYTNANDYTDVCDEAGMTNLLADLVNENCHDAAGEWAAEAELSSGNFWCVDSTGFSADIGATSKGTDTVCS